MSVVAAYHIFVCALFLVQGGMWTACGRRHTISRHVSSCDALHSTRWSRITKCVRQQNCERRAGAWADQSYTWDHV